MKGHPEARGIKALKNKWFGPKMTGFWASYSNLLFNLGLPTGFSCGRQFEARVVYIFQNYRNSFVKARLEARVIKALKKQMVWPQNDGLLGFLFKSFV